MNPAIRAASRLTFRARHVVVGGGVSAGAILQGLARSGRAGSVIAITRGDRWPTAFPRHHLLGQSRQSLTLFEGQQFHHPRGRMTVDEHMREVVSFQIQAVEPFVGNDIDCLETDVLRIIKQGNRELTLECADGSSVQAERVFFATGVGPERTLERSGVVFENHAGPRRQVFNEVTTALRCMMEDPAYWRNKSVAVYGGGATAAWIAEVAMGHSLRDLHWFAPRGFEGANPGNRNSEVLELTKHVRYKASIERLRYLGGLDSGPEDRGLELVINQDGANQPHRCDIVVCAAGSDPMAPTGIQSVLGDLYKDLVPAVGKHKGVFAKTADGSVVVTSTALTHDPEFQKLIQGVTFPVLNPENRVLAGVAVSKLSAEDAVSQTLTDEK